MARGSSLAYGEIPTADLYANVAWQKLNILTHNLQTSFQIEVLPTAKPPTWKRTACFLIRSVRTLRFEWIARAGRLVNIGGLNRLRLARNREVEGARQDHNRMTSTF